MALDPYSLCPCGSGKKVKFCCSKDIASELDKVMRALEGDQRVAALDQINKLMAAEGPRHALLALKANLQIVMDNLDEAAKTIDALFKAAPHNPVALALTSVMEASQGETESAIEKLQQALEYADDQIPHAVYSALGLVAQALLATGQVLAARGHLLLQAGMAGDRDKEPLSMLLRLNAAADLPLLLKEDHIFAESPDDAPWKGEFNAAMKSAKRGAWLAACENLTSLSEKVPDQPAIIKNIAILRGWLGQNQRTVEAWGQYASLENVPLDDAVEAGALAQLLDEDRNDTAKELTLTYPLHDTEQLMERLLSDPRVSRMPLDPQELASEDQPPPKGIFYLLDRALPASGVDIQRDAIPTVLGELYVYGKETDREARLEYALHQLSDLEQRKSALIEFAGELIGDLQQEEVTGEVSAVSAAMTWRWRLPDDTPRSRRQELIKEQQREVLLHCWPEIPLAVLDGQPAREAARSPKYRVRVLAAILLLEMISESQGQSFDFNVLRTELDLPNREVIDPAGMDVTRLSLLRLEKLDVDKLDDTNLAFVYRRAQLKHCRATIQRVAEKLIARGQLTPEEAPEVYEAWVTSSVNPDEALDHVKQAREHFEKQGASPARWLLLEFSVRMGRREVDECNRLLQTIRTRHMDEPGVAQSLHQLLVAYGVITPDGQPAGPAPPTETAPTSPTEAEQQALWNPDAQAAEPQDEGKSKLWLPGME